MKTRGITLAFAKVFLQLVIFLSISKAVSSQLSFALQKNNSSASSSKNTAVNHAYYSASMPLTQSNTASLLSIPYGNQSTVKGKQYTAPEASNSNLLSLIQSDKANTVYWLIRFHSTTFVYPETPGKEIGAEAYPTEKLLLYAIALKQYARKNGYDTTYALLSNMGLLSDKKRFFIVNLSTLEIEQAGIVAQGRGSGATRFDKQYSNVKDSRCTSLGRYKIMQKYRGEYGESYKMTGLDSTNSNAYERRIVLHAMGCIPDEEDKSQLCISEGCPAVSVNFFASLSRIIDSREKPLLLWVFDSNLEDVQAEMPDETMGPEDYESAKHHACSVHEAK